MSHIFISYSKQDITFARHLRHLLQDGGFAVWMDETRLAPSQKWWPTIEKNIDTCDAFIIIMSPASKESIWVEREILVAEKAKKPIFPVLYAGESWSRLAEIQYEDMRAGVDAQLSVRLVQELRDVVTISGSRKPPPQLPGDPIPEEPDLFMKANVNRHADDSSPSDNKKNLLSRLNEPWAIIIAAVIGGIFLLAGTLIQRANEAANTPTPDLTATHAITQTALVALPTATDLPRTPTAIAQLDITATEAMLQRTVDARETENARLLATNTQIAVQTQTAAASNISASPSETPASSATPTSVPMTSTLSIPQIGATQAAEAMSLTRTSIALTSIAIQNSVLLATLTPTQNDSSVNPVTLTIFRSEDSFTLYVPRAEDTLSLIGLEFRVTLTNGATISRRLDRDFAGFLGIPFEAINTLGAVCFHITRAGGIRPVPQACQSGVLLLSQEVAEADAFWRDFSAQLARTVLVYRGDKLMGACGPQASCPVNWPTE
jgi:hypothetical protein